MTEIIDILTNFGLDICVWLFLVFLGLPATISAPSTSIVITGIITASLMFYYTAHKIKAYKKD